jgi:hypothetical protein
MQLLHGPVLALPFMYLDPGSGSFIIQLLLAAGLGLGVALKLYWSKIKVLFNRKKVETDTSADEADGE